MHNRSAVIQGASVTGALFCGALIWIVCLRMQIRRSEAAELALSNQLEFMRVLFGGMPHCLYVRDRQCRKVVCNTVYLEVLGRSREAAMSKRISDSLIGDRGGAIRWFPK